MKPQRLQLSRAKGFRLQEASLLRNGLPAVKVDRTSRFGNPCTCDRPYSCPYSPQFEREAWTDDDGWTGTPVCEPINEMASHD